MIPLPIRTPGRRPGRRSYRRPGEGAALLGLAALLVAGCAGTAPRGGPAAPGAGAPRPVAGGWLFSLKAPQETRTVNLAGEFNGWSTSAWPMSDADGDGVWTLTVPLETGRTYEYKFVLDGGTWMTDPNAEATDPNNFDNAILVTRRPGEPYISHILPADGARLDAVPAWSAWIHAEGATFDSLSLSLADDLGRPVARLAPRLDAATGRAAADLPGDLADGGYRLTLNAYPAGGPPVSRSSGFLLDRWQGTVDSPAFYDSAVVYEIFVRSFKDGRGNDGLGDLEGVIGSLDYLNDGDPATGGDLGVDALWMMPIQPSPSDHGYDITDYEGIEADYGNMEDIRRLVTEAHRRGIRVIMDYVVNHSSDQHPFFQEARRDPASRYGSWYKFGDAAHTTWTGFGGYSGMPEFDFRSPGLRDYLLGVARYWMDLDQDGDLTDGMDGFRCDVAKGPPHGFWKELRRETKSRRPDFLLLGEVWDQASTIAPYFESEFDMNFDYPLYYSLLDLLAGRKDAGRFFADYEQSRSLYSPGAQLVRFLDNHDNNRIASVLGGRTERIRLATALLFTLPGTPLLYYGTEVGMEGVKPDPDIRRPMRWDLVAAQTADSTSLLTWHRRLIRLRRDLPALAARDDRAVRSLFPAQGGDAGVVAYLRAAPGGGDAALVVAHPGEGKLAATISVPGAPVRRATMVEVTPGAAGNTGSRGEAVDLARGIPVSLSGWQVRVFRLHPLR